MKAWFFIHCVGFKNDKHIIFCSSTPLQRSGKNYDFDSRSSYSSFMFMRDDDKEMYDFVLEKLERINPFDITLVWEADL